MSETITIHFGRPVAVFPLNSCVLLPHVGLPLHIFEPRYRRMVNDVLDGDGLIAMARYAEPGRQTEEDQGQPELAPKVCVGYCQQHERLEDGRYLILLRGLCRAEIVSERKDEQLPYRRFTLNPTEFPPPDEMSLMGERAELMRTLKHPVIKKALGLEEEEDPLLEKQVPTSAIIDVLIGRLCEEPDARYQMLEEADARKRARWLLDRLAERKDRDDGEETGAI